MGTVRDLIKRSFTLIGVLAESETPSADMQADAFSTLKEMLASWSTERLIIPAMTTENLSLVGGTANYTIGTGGTFNTTRPLRVESAAVKDGNTEIPLKVLTFEEWSQISDKTLQSSISTSIYFDPTSPLGTIKLWPVPSESRTLVLNSWKPLSEFASVGTDIELPPGYSRAIRFNLAIELAPEYSKEPSPTTVAIAMKSKANIKRMNIQPLYLGMDAALVGRSRANILTGE